MSKVEVIDLDIRSALNACTGFRMISMKLLVRKSSQSLIDGRSTKVIHAEFSLKRRDTNGPKVLRDDFLLKGILFVNFKSLTARSS